MSQASGRMTQLSDSQRERLLQRIRGAGASVRFHRIERLGLQTAPLSFAQQRMWLMDQVGPARWMNNIPSAVRVPGPLDASAVERAINEVVRRHEALRTVFRLAAGEPVQVIVPHVYVPLEILDLRSRPAGEREAEALRIANDRARLPFDLEQGPLLRASLLRLAADDHLFVLTVHHIAADGWSMAIITSELGALYSSFAAGRPSSLPELPIQYADYAVWQRKQLQTVGFESQIAYWRHKLAALPTLDFPTDRSRPLVRTHRGNQHHLWIPKRVADGLSALCRTEDATLFMGLLAVFYVALHRYTGQDDLVVGSYVAGRNREEVEPLIGFFLNTLVLRLDLSGAPSFRETLRRVRLMALEAYEHQDVPFERLVDELANEPDLSRNPLCQVVFHLQNASTITTGPTGASSAMSFARDTAVFDLAANAFETTEGISVQLEYCDELFDASTIARFAAHFDALLQSAIAQPDANVGSLTMLTEEERRCVLHTWNDTRRDRNWSIGIVDLFERQVSLAEHAEAYRCGAARVSYGELNRRANQLARHLRDRGVRDGTVVAVCLERSIESAIALQAVWKAGGVYLPLDPAFPADRLAFMMADSGASLLITDRARADLLHSPLHSSPARTIPRTILIDDERDDIAAREATNPGIRRRPEDVAYVVYTSGSTGTPKGIAATHLQVLNRLYWMWDAYPFAANEVACIKTASSFVDSLWELLGALLAGVRAAVLDDAVTRDPARLVDALAAGRVTRIWVVPSFLQVLLDTTPDLGLRLPDLTFWVSSGEPLSRSLLEQFAGAHPNATLFNLYGTSEAWDSTWHVPDVARDRGPVVPIGRPIDNTTAYVIDRHGGVAPIGVPGELCVGGVGVAGGYLNQPALSAERFLPDEYSPGGGHLYRTGDLARWRADGCLEYLGRIDDAIKIRGYRIEPAEVEAALQRHPAVARAVVVGRADASGEERLAAYCVGRGVTPPSASELSRFLRQTLPGPMVPATFTFLDAFPLTPSGKVERRALPAPAFDSMDDAIERAPEGAIEPVLAEMWSEMLGRERIGVHRNFFTELGGDSLLAMRMIARVRERFQIDLPVRSVFDAPTIAEQAANIQQASKADERALPDLVPVERERYRCTHVMPAAESPDRP